MKKSNVNQYKVQSYFEGVCKNFCILFEEVKRLENKIEELKDTCPSEELEVINRIMGMSGLKELTEKYVTHKYSKKELEKEKEKLQVKLQEYEEELSEYEREKQFWGKRFKSIRKELEELISEIKERGLTIIITKEEEIITLLFFYRDNSVKKYDIINIEEKNLIPFPASKKMYKEFYDAYCLKDENGMKEIYKKYF